MAEEYVPGSRVGHTIFEFALCEDTRNPHFHITTHYFSISNSGDILLSSYLAMMSFASPFHHHVFSGTTNFGNPLRLFLPHQMIRRPHQMRLSIISHAFRSECHALAITGEKLPVLAIGPKLAMLFKMRFCVRGNALGLRAHLRCAFRR